jgi:uncharacterized protein with NAD-binding domain and iron-sulfur cluster
LPGLGSLAQRAEELSSSPIVNIDLWFDKKWLKRPMSGLLNSPVQWIFGHDNKTQSSMNGDAFRASLVISHATGEIEQTDEALVTMGLDQIGRFFSEAKSAKLTTSLITKARRATICARPGGQGLRPAPTTTYKNLFLAGDWIRTNLPATIESAVKSGNMAAAIVG